MEPLLLFSVFNFASKSSTFPLVFVTLTFFPSYNAIPALSYPLYSRRLKPFIITDLASLCPMYPTIPHIILVVRL